MKKLLTIALTLISAQVFACPTLSNSYHQCEMVAELGNEDGIQIQYEFYDKLAITQEDESPYGVVYSIKESYLDYPEYSEELNPYETVIVGEVRTIRTSDELGDFELTVASSCTDSSLNISAKYSGIEDGSSEAIEGEQTTKYELTDDGIRVTTMDTENGNMIGQVVECKRVK